MWANLIVVPKVAQRFENDAAMSIWTININPYSDIDGEKLSFFLRVQN